MIVLDTPKGWTGPKVVDGKQVEGTFRAHQVPLTDPASNPQHLQQLSDWLRSYRPEELFDSGGRLLPDLAELAPSGSRRMGANPNANGGLCCVISGCPTSATMQSRWPARDARIGDTSSSALSSGRIKLNPDANFRLFGPDETDIQRLETVFQATNRQWQARPRRGMSFWRRPVACWKC